MGHTRHGKDHGQTRASPGRVNENSGYYLQRAFKDPDAVLRDFHKPTH